MKTPTYRPVLRALAAAAVAIAGSSLAVPALAQDTADPAVPNATAAPAGAGISDAGLADAVRRDLGMTMEQFNAAGAQTRPASDSAPAHAGRQETAAAATAGLVAGSAEQLFQAYVRDVGPAGLQAVAFADGHFIIRTGGINTPEDSTADHVGDAAATAQPAPGKVSPADFVARYANVALEKGAPIRTEEDYYGGQGFVIDKMTICSAGFGGFDAAGLPLVLTAGHCAEDGRAVRADVEPATAAPAGGATTALPAVPDRLGTFGFSQFGGPGNSPITGSEANPGNIGTDIAVIRNLRSDLKVQPSATLWNSLTAPGRTSVKIIGTAAPYQGQPVCRSGRTGGWSCGVVAETGIYVAAGSPTPGTACTDAGGVPLEPCTLRAFKGFLSYDVQSSGGDSGGPWISGNFAVGTHSAGEPAGAAQNFAVAATLEDALGRIPGGVELQVFLNKPSLAAGATAGAVAPGSRIRGHVGAAPASAVAAGSKVRLVRGDAEPVEVPVDASGNWSFAAPADGGAFHYTAETVNGHSRSGAVDFDLRVAGLATPVITVPAAGATVTELDRIAGTGTPGTSVTVSGDVTGSAMVGADGHWSLPAGQHGYGKLSVAAVQTAPGSDDSRAATLSFQLQPPAPALAKDWNGPRFRKDALPDAIDGTGIAGASVNVLLDGRRAGAVTASDDGRWSLPFPAGLAAGTHELAVTQSVDGVDSKPLNVTFRIEPVAAAAAQAEPAARGQRPAAPAAGPHPGPAAAGPGAYLAPAPLVAAPAAPPAPGAPAPAATPTPPAPAATAAPTAPAVTPPPARSSTQASDPADAGRTPSAGQHPGTAAGSFLPLAGLAGGAVLLGAAVLVGARIARRRGVR